MKHGKVPDEPRDAAGLAIARVLQAERAARESIDGARRQVEDIAEGARADARAVAERTDRRIRRVAQAFDQAIAQRLAAIDAEAARIEALPPPDETERAAVARAVEALAREWIGADP